MLATWHIRSRISWMCQVASTAGLASSLIPAESPLPNMHEPWANDKDEEHEQDEHDDRDEEGKQYGDEDQHIFQKAQHDIEKTSSSDGGN